MTLPDSYYLYMTSSTADRSDASTWGSRQPPPHAQAYARKTLTIGAKDFSENQIVAYMYLLLLHKAKIPVNGDVKKNLTSFIATPALQRGDIDIFPEYTGTGLEAV